MSFFIAEISSNHSQSIERSLEFIDVAARIGCDAVKFQLFKVVELFAPEILVKSQTHRDRENWELPPDFLPILAERCQERGLKFGCTPFYLGAVKELEPHVDFYKISSYELLWDDLLTACAMTGKPVIISTGMATVDEITRAVENLRVKNCEPAVLHCVSSYPAPYFEANLSAMQTISEATGCEIGWSDHTVDPGVIHRAVHKWGATYIEFHLDLDGNGQEFGAGHCWLPQAIEKVITEVKHAEGADGNGLKVPGPSESADRLWRADPSDGLRPFRSIRKRFSC